MSDDSVGAETAERLRRTRPPLEHERTQRGHAPLPLRYRRLAAAQRLTATKPFLTGAANSSE